MTTGQSPKRRETPEQEKARHDRLNERRKAQESLVWERKALDGIMQWVLGLRDQEKAA